jgi:uncharacterized membrane protein YgcG
VGLSKSLRDAAEAGKITWELARQFQYASVAFQGFSALDTLFNTPQEVAEFITSLESPPSLPTATPQPSNSQVTPTSGGGFTSGGGTAGGGGGGGAGAANTTGSKRDLNYKKLSK